MQGKTTLILPPIINLTILRNKKTNETNIYCYNQINFLKLFIKNNVKYFIDNECNSIILENNKISSKNKSINFLKKLLKSWDLYFYKKIKLKGKGYRLRFFKKNKIMKFFLGRSHMTVYKFTNLKLKKIGKYKFILKSCNFDNLIKISKNVTKIKNLNIFTQRGLRISRQIVFKRKGKKGSYV